MSPRYLLDADTISDLVRNPRGAVARRIEAVDIDAVFTSIVVVAELRYGAVRRRSRRLTVQLEEVLRGVEVLPFASPAEDYYAVLRADLEAQGKPIGSNDMLIAAHALSLGAAVVTGNIREFSRVRGLLVENWLRPA